jgi:hypothetical protein
MDRSVFKLEDVHVAHIGPETSKEKVIATLEYIFNQIRHVIRLESRDQ